MSIEELKKAAGAHAAMMVASGMVVGLGSGSTARYATLHLAERVREGEIERIVGIPTSNETEALARQEGIPLTMLNDVEAIDLTIDGADEVDPDLNVIKGLGGFLLREKIVAAATRREVIVVDETKLVQKLGTQSPLPVEVVQFGWRHTTAAIERTGGRPERRLSDDGSPYITDEGNFIVDCYYDGGIDHPEELAVELDAIPGVVENGLFLGQVQTVVVASSSGIRVLER
jgi:ribose 5-phosphate isomerase A